MPVKSIPYNSSALEAFELMVKYNLSGLAVIDENGEIMHNMSSTDIRLWLFAQHSLEVSVEEFLIGIRKLKTNKNTKAPVMVCTLQNGLKKIVDKLKATKWHRIWVVDDHRAPIGVLSMTDLFRFIVHPVHNEKKLTKLCKIEEQKSTETHT